MLLAVHLVLGVWCLLNGVSALPLLLTFVPLVMFFIMALYALRREKEAEIGGTWYLEIGKSIKHSESVKGRERECGGEGESGQNRIGESGQMGKLTDNAIGEKLERGGREAGTK